MRFVLVFLAGCFVVLGAFLGYLGGHHAATAGQIGDARILAAADGAHGPWIIAVVLLSTAGVISAIRAESRRSHERSRRALFVPDVEQVGTSRSGEV